MVVSLWDLYQFDSCHNLFRLRDLSGIHKIVIRPILMRLSNKFLFWYYMHLDYFPYHVWFPLDKCTKMLHVQWASSFSAWNEKRNREDMPLLNDVWGLGYKGLLMDNHLNFFFFMVTYHESCMLIIIQTSGSHKFIFVFVDILKVPGFLQFYFVSLPRYSLTMMEPYNTLVPWTRMLGLQPPWVVQRVCSFHIF